MDQQSTSLPYFSPFSTSGADRQNILQILDKLSPRTYCFKMVAHKMKVEIKFKVHFDLSFDNTSFLNSKIY